MRQAYTLNAGTMNLYNSVAEGCTQDAVERVAGTMTTKNVASFNNTDDFEGTVNADYCISDDGDGTNSQSPSGGNWANEFADYANGDFTPQSGGNIEDNGVGPSSDATVPATDMSGETRSGTTCDIGPNEIVSAGTAYDLTATDGVTASATVGAFGDFLLSLVDGVTAADSTSLLLIAITSILAGVTAGTIVSVRRDSIQTHVDGAVAGDSSSETRESTQTHVDGAVAGDSSNILLDLVLTVADGVEASDVATSIATYINTHVDGIVASDIVTYETPGTDTTIVMTFTAKEGKIKLTIKKPTIGFSGKAPDIDFTGE